jgi:phosphatidate cytidylyltransferase
LITRILTALALLGLVIPLVVLAEPRWFFFFVILVFAILLWEWLRLLRVSRGALIALPVAFVTSLALLLSDPWLDFRPVAVILVLVCSAGWCVVLFAALSGRWSAGPFLGAIWAFTATLGAFSAIWLAYQQSLLALLLAFLLVWVADSGAYFAGKWFGHSRLAPSISPGKTWEGVLGAVLLSLFVMLGLAAWIPHGWNWAVAYRWGYPALALTVLVFTFLSVAGDLYQSLLKRRSGVKDSGRLLPGHGGIYDRLDAAVVVLPFTVLAQLWAESRV